MPAIYKISSIRKPERFYIGSAVEPQKRWLRHLQELRKNKHCNTFLQAHYNAWSEADFLFEIIEECIPENLIWMEQYYIDLLKPKMNLCQIAGSRTGIPQSVTTRAKLREAWKNRPPISMSEHLRRQSKT